MVIQDGMETIVSKKHKYNISMGWEVYIKGSVYTEPFLFFNKYIMETTQLPPPKKITKKRQAKLLAHANRDALHTVKRSGKWPGVKKKHLKLNSTCAACGTKNDLEVHHKKPYHLHPELELDLTNLITLCMENLCHIDIGHGDSFKAYNPNVAEDANTVLANKDQLKRILAEVSVKAKQQRLFE
jgi:hypothetical protein